MAYSTEIIADSINELDQRLTTFEITLPRFVLAEFNTHRMFSRNSASSRAIPVEKQLGKVLDDPFIPIYWGKNQSGMQAASELSPEEAQIAETEWLVSRDYAVLGAVALIGGLDQLKNEQLKTRIGELRNSVDWKGNDVPATVHKQTANRLLEPFMWHTIIVTATDWDNFYALRDNPQAQPEIQHSAHAMRNLYTSHSPEILTIGEWHLPLIQEDEKDMPIDLLKKISVGRCTRVSYLTHNNVRDHKEDIGLHDKILNDGHMSPFEHVARSMDIREQSKNGEYSGNFRGWHQYRKDIPGENNFASLQDA
ncbi:MAG TPA: FAD-dependent thymidylate synthase [Candidatus Saccharimonadales bacterium]